MSVIDDRVPDTVRDYLDEGHKAPLATVVKTW